MFVVGSRITRKPIAHLVGWKVHCDAVGIPVDSVVTIKTKGGLGMTLNEVGGEWVLDYFDPAPNLITKSLEEWM